MFKNIVTSLSVLLMSFTIGLLWLPQTFALTNYSATVPNLNGSGIPTTLTVGHPYTFSAAIHVNQRIPHPINSAGIRDVFGLSLDKINSSGGKTLNDPLDNSVTVQWLGANRGRRNDSQQAYTFQGDVFPGGHSRWDDFQCGEVWSRTANTGDTINISCTFTPKTTGFYQLDINSYYYYATWIQNCYSGYCGPIGGYFIKVVPCPTVVQPSRIKTSSYFHR